MRVTTGRYWDERIETLPLDDRRQVTDHRLHWQIRRCWDGSPFYRARLEAAGLDPSTLTGAADLSKLPPLRISDLVEECEQYPPFGRLTVAPEKWWQEADADQPQPRRVRTDGDVSHVAGLAARAAWAAGARPAHGLSFVGNDTSDVAQAVEGGVSRIGGLRAAAPASAQRSGDFRVGVGGDGPASSDLHAVWLLGEAYTDGQGDGPRVAYGLPIVAPTLAYECDVGIGVHWADDHWLIEVIDPATFTAPRPGEAGTLILTDLTREGSPLLRYWTGFETTLETEICRCGRTQARSLWIRPLA
jgi:phenylacetate-CoA ligase